MQRIPGFDLARAYAIWGMFIVNFNVVFGRHDDPTPLGRFLAFFNGNSSTLFVMLAGMGLSILARSKADAAARHALRTVVLKRAAFLFAAGLLLQLWWPADILHCYGGYMSLAAWLLFVPRAGYLWAALGAVGVFHLLLAVLTGKTNLTAPGALPPESPALILAFSTGFYLLSVGFSTVWLRRFRHGPLETLMRRISG